MIDPNSETWKAVVDECRQRIESHQRKLEGPLDQPETDRARGYIRAMRDIIVLGQRVNNAGDTYSRPVGTRGF